VLVPVYFHAYLYSSPYPTVIYGISFAVVIFRKLIWFKQVPIYIIDISSFKFCDI